VYLVPLALRHSWISAIGVKDMATGLATEVVGQSLVDRCSDRRTSRTARSTAKQATKDGASNDTQRMAPALGFSAGKGRRGTLDRPRHATEGSGRGLSTTSRDEELRAICCSPWSDMDLKISSITHSFVRSATTVCQGSTCTS
jgi:hypothetical protein